MTKLKTKVDFLKRGLNTSKQHDYLDLLFESHTKYISHDDVCKALKVQTRKAHNLKSQFVDKFNCKFKEDDIDGLKFFRLVDIDLNKELKAYIIKREAEMKRKIRVVSEHNYIYEPGETDLLLNSIFKPMEV